MVQARGFFERALALDPLNVDALASKAWVDVLAANSFITTDRVARVAAAEAATTKVLSLAPNHAFAHFVLGSAYIYTNRGALGIAECEHALSLDRSLAAAHAIIGHGKNTVGRAEETEGHIVEALRLSPRDIMAYHWMFLAGVAKLQPFRCAGSTPVAVASTNRMHQCADGPLLRSERATKWLLHSPDLTPDRQVRSC